MPLSAHGERMKARMRKEYGAAGDRVLYSSENAGKPGFTDIHRKGYERGKSRKHHRRRSRRS